MDFHLKSGACIRKADLYNPKKPQIYMYIYIYIYIFKKKFQAKLAN